jgi:hypothetical protein
MSAIYSQKLHATSADRKNKSPFCAGLTGGRPQRAAAALLKRPGAGQSTPRQARRGSGARYRTAARAPGSGAAYARCWATAGDLGC